MELERYLPTAPLQPYIKDYLFIENGAEVENRVLPDTSMVLSVRYRGQLSIQGDRVPEVVLSGIRKSFKNVCYGVQSGNLLVRFTAGGAAAFFSEPLNEWTDQTVPVAFLKHCSDVHQLADRLAACSNNEERVMLMDKVLMSRLAHAARPDILILSALQKIQAAGGILPIRQLIGELYISQDAFEKRFRQVVGTSPKHFSAIIRFRNAITAFPGMGSLTQTALAAGYYDQAHFIRAFKTFTGETPGQFFRDRRYW